MFEGKCHCGAVSFEIKTELKWLTECNCSICSQLGVTWAHGIESDVEIQSAEGTTNAYVWGDKSIAFHTCKTCGCTTHWKSLTSTPSTRMAVNSKLVKKADIKHLPIRFFDGATSFKYLD